MASPLVRRLALFAALSGTALGSDNADLEHRIAELREVLEVENSKLQHMESVRSSRNLRDDPAKVAKLPPSIHGIGNPGHRAYTYVEEMNGALDSFWLLICGALVMFMQAGFAMVEAGCCRAKNVQSILLKNLTDAAVGTVGWYIFGWSFAYSGPMLNGFKENRMAGREAFLGHNFVNDIPSNHQLEPTLSPLNWFFQWAFCMTAATIVSGGVAERVNFFGYTIFSFCMTTFIYPIIVAWTWGYGFLADMNQVGYMDFAGSGVVHLTGGIAALVGAAIAGQRTGRFPEDWGVKKRILDFPDKFDPHSQPLIVVGTMSLWFGWYGFNCGSTLAMHTAEKGFLAAHVAMNTTLAASVGGIVVFGLRYAMLRRYDIGGLCNGILAGLVSITAGCATVDHGVAIFIGIFGGCVFQLASAGLKAAKIDDPIDAFAVHGACGMWGVFAAGLLDWGAGYHHAHGWNGFKCNPGTQYTASHPCGPENANLGEQLLLANFVEIIVICLWSGGLSAIVFAVLRAAKFLRTTDEEGGDAKKHSPSKAYAEDDAPAEDDKPLASI